MVLCGEALFTKKRLKGECFHVLYAVAIVATMRIRKFIENNIS